MQFRDANHHRQFNYFNHKWSTDGTGIIFTDSDTDSDNEGTREANLPQMMKSRFLEIFIERSSGLLKKISSAVKKKMLNLAFKVTVKLAVHILYIALFFQF